MKFLRNFSSLAFALVAASPVAAFSAEECAENYIAEGLPLEARAEALPDYFVEPGQIGSPLICTLVPSEAFGPIIQVSAAMADSPNGAFVQYLPGTVQILRTEGDGAGLSLTICGPIAEDLHPERNPGGFWCRIDLSLGRGVIFDLEYGPDGALAWMNFEISAGEGGILANSTLAPVLRDTAPEALRAAVFLTGSGETHLLRYARAADVFRTVEPQAMIQLHRAIRETPQDMTIVVETGDPDTGPYAQADIPARMVAEVMAELALLERLIRTQRGV